MRREFSRLQRAVLKAQSKKHPWRQSKSNALDEELFPSGNGYFFQDFIGGAPFILLYEQDNYATLPAFIDAFVRLIEEGDHAPFRMLTAPQGGDIGISQGMYNAIACNDNWHGAMKRSLQQDFAEYPVLSMIFGDPELIDEMARICKRYGAQPRPAEDYLAVETDIRTLIVEGQMDPITPPPLAKEILAGFSNGTYVEFPFAGHGPTRSVECAGDFLTKFFDNPEGDLDTSCVDEMTAPEFAGPLFATNALSNLATMAAEDEKKVAAPGLWLGASALILIFGAFIYTAAPVARLINSHPAMSTGGARFLAWITALLGASSVVGLGYAGYATYEANEFLLLVGLLDWARWFSAAGYAAGASGLVLLWMTVRARAQAPMPIGVLLGLLLTSIASVALALFQAVFGVLPI